jgi:hypothetical protein
VLSKAFYGIKSALANASRAGLTVYACGVAYMMFFFLMTKDLWFENISGFANTVLVLGWFWIIAALIIALAYGGVDIINHYLLRIIVHRNGYAPMKLGRFLDYCTRLIFLRKVGGGYIFIHRLLLEHFAARWEAEHMQNTAKAPVTAGFAVGAST